MRRNPRTLGDIAHVARYASQPEPLRSLIALIEDQRGYPLYQAVSAVKAALSHVETARLRFAHAGLKVDRDITRAEFESWIANDIQRMGAVVDRVLDEAAIAPEQVDHVFLTGGTSLVPAVRRLFAARFGGARLTTGGEFVSVAEGLALIGRDRAASRLA